MIPMEGKNLNRKNMKKYKWIIISCIAIIALAGIIEYSMGRLPLGPDRRFGWWDGNIYGSENSQRVFDAYSLTHVIHGFGFYLLLWLVARRLPFKYRFVAAVLLEAAWEVFENSPFIINRYRAETVNFGYTGDSILNSLCDVVMMCLGFWAAYKFKVWQSILTIIGIEVFLLLWVRDNLTLNIIMLIHPLDFIKNWQAQIAPSSFK